MTAKGTELSCAEQVAQNALDAAIRRTRPDARLPMVNWFDPRQLLRTACEVVLSTIFGKYSDCRLTEALNAAVERVARPAKPAADSPDASSRPPAEYAVSYDEELDCFAVHLPEGRSDIWIDYVSDTGDGWNSTYGVAYHVAQENLRLRIRNDSGSSHKTRRGELLLFGGDQCYPTASRECYDQRLLGPYETALCYTTRPHPAVFAIPGNHDWYDNLVSFTRLFCSRRWIGGWKSMQRRSYFAIRLPYGWWLFGIDVQLGSDIDAPQLAYFKGVVESMGADDRIVLCNAEPYWMHVKTEHEAGRQGGPKGRATPEAPPEVEPAVDETSLEYLERKILKGRVALFIAGDLHHYCHRIRKDGAHMVIAGGGGAFLHLPIEHFDAGSGGHDAALEPLEGSHVFPNRVETDALLAKVPGFWGRNPSFGGLTALAYWLTAWALLSSDWRQCAATVNIPGTAGPWDWLGTLFAQLRAFELSAAGGMLIDLASSQFTLLAHLIVLNPTAGFWVLAVLGGAILFTDTRNALFARVAGVLHGLFHLSCAYVLGLVALGLTGGWLSGPSVSPTLCFLALLGLTIVALFPHARILLGSCTTAIRTGKLLHPTAQLGWSEIASFVLLGGLAYFTARQATVWCGNRDAGLFSNTHLFSWAILALSFGSLVGPHVMGLYLWISSRFFGQHGNEASSSLQCEDFKNFLKLKIDPGNLTIYPIGMARAPQQWKPSSSTANRSGQTSIGPLLEPQLAAAGTCGCSPIVELIHEPIVIPNPRPSPGPGASESRPCECLPAGRVPAGGNPTFTEPRRR
ncbi:MAG: hypothetical protein HY816_21070 [Candidatus Wallbacteria bacterium]|nr:hypothetical protein [Candidatus Wallbacteria bacterium]